MLRALRHPPAAPTPSHVFLFISFLCLRPRQCPPLGGLGDLKLNPWGSGREGTATQQFGWIPAPGIGGGSGASGGQVPVWGGALGHESFLQAQSDPLIPSRLGLAVVSWHCALGRRGCGLYRLRNRILGCAAPVAKCCKLQNFCELRWGLGTAISEREERYLSLRLLFKLYI